MFSTNWDTAGDRRFTAKGLDMFAITRGRLTAAAFGLTAAVAAAQSPLAYGPVAGCPFGNCAAANHGTYGPALFAANPNSKHFKLPGPDEPGCVGRSSYPLSDWHYIRQFCGPTLQPGTCYGHFQTKWRRWEETCAGAGCPAGPDRSSPVLLPAPLVSPPVPVPTPVQPQFEVLPPPKEDKPKDPPKVPPPAEPGKISTTEAAVPMAMPTERPVVPPTREPRVVVPPTPR